MNMGRNAALAPAEGVKTRVCSDVYLNEKFDSNQSIPIQTKDILKGLGSPRP